MTSSKTYVVSLALLAGMGASWAEQPSKASIGTRKDKSQYVYPKGEFDRKETGLDNSEYREALVAFIKELDNTYPFFKLKGIQQDWNIYKKQALERIEDCNSNDEFYRLLDEARRCLRDAHIRFKGLKKTELQIKPHFYPGLSFLPAINKQVVIMNCPKEYITKMPIGTIVSEIDGNNARRFLDQAAGKSWAKG